MSARLAEFSSALGVLLASCCFLLGLPVLVDAADSTANPAVSLKVMTFNIRYGTAADGPNRWDLRKERVVQTIRDLQPDLLGTQETMSFQADYLQQNLDEYQRVGKLREPASADSEQCAVFFLRDRFIDLEQGHFWLSKMPDIPGSKSWDSSLPRMVTWLKLFDQQSQRPIYFFNTHFDHRGAESRREAALLLAQRISTLDPQIPVVVTGDFNCGEDSPPYQALLSAGPRRDRLRDAYRLAQPTHQPDEGTFNGFQGDRSGARIDWILISPHFRVESAAIVSPAPDQPTPSDHFPVTATLLLDVGDGA